MSILLSHQGDQTSSTSIFLCKNNLIGLKTGVGLGVCKEIHVNSQTFQNGSANALLHVELHFTCNLSMMGDDYLYWFFL